MKLKFNKIQNLLFMTLFCLYVNAAQASNVEIFDPMKAFKKELVQGQMKYQFDEAYVDKSINSIWNQAINYPTTFKSQTNKEIAKYNVEQMIRLFSVLQTVYADNEFLMYREAVINHMGYNLDIKDTFGRAEDKYTQLLLKNPDDAKTHHLYGHMLSNAGYPKRAIPSLEKAVSLGKHSALFTLSLAHLSVCNLEKATLNMDKYMELYPEDKKAQMFHQAMNSGKGLQMVLESQGAKEITTSPCA